MTIGLPFLSALLYAQPSGGGGATSYVNSVQYFEITIADGLDTANATIDSVTPSRAFIVGVSVENPGYSMGCDELQCDVTLTDATTITASRWRTFGTAIVRGYIVDATSNLVETVQYAHVDWESTTATSFTTSISAVTLANSIIINLGGKNSYSGSVDVPGRSMGYWSFNSATEIELNKGAGFTTLDGKITCCVVEFKASAIASVQEVTFNGDAGGSLYLEASISSVNTANTVLFSGGSTSDINNDSRGRNGFTLQSATAARCYVGADIDQTSTATLWVVEFVSGVVSKSEQNTLTLATATTGSVSLSQSYGTSSTVIPLGATFGLKPSSSIREVSIGLELTDVDEITATNGSSVDAEDVMYFQVVEWSV